MINNIEKGRKGEDIAVEYLKKAGYKIIDRNWHYSKNAEIDIIAEENEILVFIEVKARTSLNYGHPFESITRNKIKKIHNAISEYTNMLPKRYKAYRFDGIAIVGFNNPEIEHLKNLGQY